VTSAAGEPIPVPAAPLTRRLPQLAFQRGRLRMDARARTLGIPSVRNISLAYRLRGNLDVSALLQALEYVVVRHEGLRAFFPSGSQDQVISDAAALDVPVVEFPDPMAAECAIPELLAESAMTPFAAEMPPRLRAVVYRIGSRDHVLSLLLDHMICDAWARRIVLADLSTAYASSASGRSPEEELQPLGYTYGDYVLDEQRVLNGPSREEHLAYWRRRLRGLDVIPRVDLPRPEGAAAPAEGAEVLLDRPVPLPTRQEGGEDGSTTPFHAILAATFVTLYAVTRRRSATVAVHRFNRNTDRTRGLVAPLADLMLVRGDVDGRLGLGEVLRRTRESVLESEEHADLPFGEIVRELAPERYGDPAYPIGLVVNVLYEEVLDDDFRLSELECSRVPVREERVRPRTMLGIGAVVAGGAVTLSSQFQRDRLDPANVESLLRTVARVLEAIRETPDLPVAAVVGGDAP